MSHDAVCLKREEFYDLVWSEPMSKLAQKYGLSDVGLARICKKHNIPRPSRGWWAQKYAGYNVQQAPLPKGEAATIWIYPNLGGTTTRDEARTVTTEIKKRLPKHRTVAPEQLTNPHPLIEESADKLKSSEPDETGRVRPSQSECLNIQASKGMLPKALLIMDTIIKVLNSMDYTVSVSEGQTRVLIDGVSIAIALREELTRRRLQAKDHDLEANYYQFGYGLYKRKLTACGKLCLSIEDTSACHEPQYRTHWRDTESRKVEDSLNGFIIGLLRATAIKRNSLTKKQEEEQNEPRESQ